MSLRHDAVEFAHKQTLFGIVLMVRYASPSGIPGEWELGQWQKARFYELYHYENSRSNA